MTLQPLRATPLIVLASAIALLMAANSPAQTNLRVGPLAGFSRDAFATDKTSVTLQGPLSGPAQTQTVNLTSTPAETYVAGPLSPTTPWLSISPATGSISPSPPTVLTVKADPSMVPSAGTYQGYVQILGQTTGSFQLIFVTYTVTGGGSNNAFTATPSPVSFTQPVGGTASAQVQLTSTTPTSFTATAASTPSGWLTVAASGTTTPANLTVSVNTSGLAAMTYQGTITVTGGGASLSIPVNLTVTSGTPNTITATPSSVPFTQVLGGPTPASQMVQLSSPTPTSFTAAAASAPTTWLAVTPSSGMTPANLILSVNPAGLVAGTYSGSVTVTGGATTVTISVTLTVSATATIIPTPSSLSFTQILGGATPATQTVQLSSATPTTFTAAATSTPITWLTVTPSSGMTPANLTVSVNPASLVAGTYPGAITITGGATTVTVNVTLSVLSTSTNIITPSPLAAAFSQLVGQNTFSLQNIQLNANAPTNFVVSVPSSATWLTVTPSSGTTPATLTLSATAGVNPPSQPTALAAGAYQTTISVTGGASTVSIPVMLTVSAAPNAIATAPASVSFAQIAGGAAPAAQSLKLDSPSPTNFTTSNTQTWLTVAPTSGTTPATLMLTVNAMGLAIGAYQDSITINGGAAPVTVPVTLTVSNDMFVAAPTSLSFKQTAGGNPPGTQTVQLTSSVPRNYIASTTVDWLSVAPTIGITPATLTVSASGAGLAVGTYMGSIMVNGAGAPLSIPVTLTVATATGAIFNPASLAFSFTAGGQTPPSQTVAVSSAASDFAFTATATAGNGGTWLSVTPTSGMTPATLTVAVSPTGLSSGRYSGIITVTPTDTSIPVQNLPVTLTVNGGSSGGLTFVRSILNAASFLPGPIAPGEIITVTGLGLGPTVGVGPNILASGAVDTLLAGMRLLFDGIPAPLLFVRSDQINAIVPYNLYGRTGTNMQLEVSGVRSDPIGLRVENTAPAMFTIDGSGRGQAAIVNQDGTVNSAADPASAGSIVAIYGTGEGQTNPPGQDGRIVSTDLRTPLAPVSVKIGGLPAQVRYVGSAPGSVSGLFQLNVAVPAGLVPGPQLPVEVMLGQVPTQAGATMAVK